MVLIADDRARRTTTSRECALHHQSWGGAQRELIAALPDVLEAGLIHNRRTDDLRVADLHRVFAAMRVVTDGWKRKLSNAAVVLCVMHVLIADRQGVAGRKLEVEAWADIQHGRRTGDGCV